MLTYSHSVSVGGYIELRRDSVCMLTYSHSVSVGGYLELRRDSVCMLTYADVFSLCLSRWISGAAA